MDDYRKRHQQKWMAEKSDNVTTEPQSVPAPEASASSGAPAVETPAVEVPAVETPAVETPAAAASSSEESIKRVHILPLGARCPAPVFSVLRERLIALRAERSPIFQGRLIEHEDQEFIVVKCDPPRGVLGPETDYFFDGDPVVRFTQTHFLAMPNAESTQSSSALFSEYIGPYFHSMAENAKQSKEMPVLFLNESINIFGLDFFLAASEPSGLGVIDTNTLFYVDWDTTPEFERVHVVPFQDTLPRVYNYDLFNDYLKPFFKQNTQTKFSVNEQFTFHGVQFKVVCGEPEGPARVGRGTSIHCEGVLHPSLRNLLPPELLLQLSYLPPGLQMLLLNTDALGSGEVYERLMEVQEMLHSNRGLQNETIEQLESFEWNEDRASGFDQTQCMVCLCDFAAAESVRKLPCNHVFHCNCIDEWLRRCTDCPICKLNVDRSLRDH